MAKQRVEHYSATYNDFAAQVYTAVRAEAFGEDIGQTGWLTREEHDMFLSWLQPGADSMLLDVACGSGGPSLRAAQRTGCRVRGIDLHQDAVKTARAQAGKAGLTALAEFQQADAGKPLPFPDSSFDAIVCVDAINHLPDRPRVLKDWARILKPQGRVLFTDPIIITGPITNTEMEIRSSIGFFLFVPPGFDEEVLSGAGFQVTQKEDRTENMARLARQWHRARENHSADLRRVEGDETFEGQQRFFDVAANLAEERRLSRVALCAQIAG